MGLLQFSKAIRFSAGLNEAGANFTFTCKFELSAPDKSELIVNQISNLHTEVEHKHFNFDFAEIKKDKIELKEVLGFLIERIKLRLPEEKLIWCELSQGDITRLQASL